MTDYSSIDLGQLKLPQLKSLCVQARKDGRLAKDTKCTGTKVALTELLESIAGKQQASTDKATAPSTQGQKGKTKVANKDTKHTTASSGGRPKSTSKGAVKTTPVKSSMTIPADDGERIVRPVPLRIPLPYPSSRSPSPSPRAITKEAEVQVAPIDRKHKRRHSPTDPMEAVLTSIATYLSYDKMLALLAARPDNTTLVRGLYDPNSSFWRRRVGAITGKRSLVLRTPEETKGDVEASVRPTSAKKDTRWSPRLQHHTLVPRGGNIVMGCKGQVYSTDITNVRQAIILDPRPAPLYDPQRGKGETQLVVLDNEGKVYVTDLPISSDAGKCSGYEDGPLHTIKMQRIDRPFFRRYMEGVPIFDHKIRTMVALDHIIVYLDYEGKLWISTKNVGSMLSLSIVELPLPRIMEDDGQVRFIRKVSARPVVEGGPPDLGVGEPMVHYKSLLLITMSSRGTDYLVDFTTSGAGKSIVVYPSIISIPEEAYVVTSAACLSLLGEEVKVPKPLPRRRLRLKKDDEVSGVVEGKAATSNDTAGKRYAPSGVTKSIGSALPLRDGGTIYPTAPVLLVGTSYIPTRSERAIFYHREDDYGYAVSIARPIMCAQPADVVTDYAGLAPTSKSIEVAAAVMVANSRTAAYEPAYVTLLPHWTMGDLGSEYWSRRVARGEVALPVGVSTPPVNSLSLDDSHLLLVEEDGKLVVVGDKKQVGGLIKGNEGLLYMGITGGADGLWCGYVVEV